VKFKWVGRLDKESRILRLCRLMWTRGMVGDGNGYSVKLSLALRPAFFCFHREWQQFFLTVLGVRVHFQRSYGGIHV
jgi:hypothetical protein